MNHDSAPALLAVLTLALLGDSPSRAEPVQAAFTGEVTSVTDPLGIFNNTFGIGSPVSGSYAYLPSEMRPSPVDPFTIGYISSVRPNSASLSAVLGRAMLRSFDSPTLVVFVTNDKPLVGDALTMTTAAQYPANFLDLDPDLFDVSFPGLSLSLTDPTGTAFTSTALPTSVPDLSRFATAEGSVLIEVTNVNTGEDFSASVRFRLTSLTGVPEPSAIVLFASGLLALVGVTAGRRGVWRGHHPPTKGKKMNRPEEDEKLDDLEDEGEDDLDEEDDMDDPEDDDLEDKGEDDLDEEDDMDDPEDLDDDLDDDEEDEDDEDEEPASP